jgi:hypothetical protein
MGPCPRETNGKGRANTARCAGNERNTVRAGFEVGGHFLPWQGLSRPSTSLVFVGQRLKDAYARRKAGLTGIGIV